MNPSIPPPLQEPFTNTHTFLISSITINYQSSITHLPSNHTMSSSSSRVVPVFGSSETPVHYLTVREEDYPEIERWLAKYGFEYGRFFASYINYRTCRPLSAAISMVLPLQ